MACVTVAARCAGGRCKVYEIDFWHATLKVLLRIAVVLVALMIVLLAVTYSSPL